MFAASGGRGRHCAVVGSIFRMEIGITGRSSRVAGSICATSDFMVSTKCRQGNFRRLMLTACRQNSDRFMEETTVEYCPTVVCIDLSA